MFAQHLYVPAYLRRAFGLTVAMAAFTAWAAGQNNEPAGSVANVPSSITPAVNNAAPPTAAGLNGKTTERLREGTKLTDVTGSFQSIGGDSVSFSPTGKEPFRVLENLALQRVAKVLDENKGARQWTVSGVITEFRETNYLLITKAVIQLQEGDSATSR